MLVVDDNEELAENLAEILELDGLEAATAGSAEEALDVLAKNDFGLVLTDVRMPGMDGVTLLRLVRERWPGLPVIVMTAYTREVDLERARAHGALQVLKKPVEPGAVVGLITRVLGESGHVLVLEDNDDLRVGFAEALLEADGAVPHTARTVAEAMRIIDEVDVRAAILDARLPDGSGVDVGRVLATREEDVLVIYVTGYPEDVVAAAVQASAVLPKPVESTVLLGMIKTVVESER